MRNQEEIPDDDTQPRTRVSKMPPVSTAERRLRTAKKAEPEGEEGKDGEKTR